MLSFFVLVDGKVDEEKLTREENAKILNSEQANKKLNKTFHILDNIQFQNNKTETMQWERNQSSALDIQRMQATLSK